MRLFRLVSLIIIFYLTGLGPVLAGPVPRTTGYQWIGWLKGEFVTVEESVLISGTVMHRLEAFNPATRKSRLLLTYSNRDSYAKKAAFNARIKAIATAGQPGIIIRAMPAVAKNTGAVETVSTPIALFPEQTLMVRSRALGQYALELVSSRNNSILIADLTAWLHREHPALYQPKLIWGPKFYIDQINIAPQGVWAAAIVEVHYAVENKDNEVYGATLAFFRANTLSARLYNLDGYRAYRFKEYYTALPYFQWAALQDPTFDIPVYNMACTYGLLGLDESAIASLIQSIRLNPRNKEKAKRDPDLAKLKGRGMLDSILR